MLWQQDVPFALAQGGSTDRTAFNTGVVLHAGSRQRHDSKAGQTLYPRVSAGR